MRKNALPKYVSEFKDRHGKWRTKFRRKGYLYYFKNKPFTPGFQIELDHCLGYSADALSKVERVPPGSISALIALYYTTPKFQHLEPSTKATYRSILERFREKHGQKSVSNLQTRHIMSILGKMHETPGAANKLLIRLRSLMKLAIQMDWRRDDPTYSVDSYSSTGDGFHTWTDDELTKFELHYPTGTKPRLAYALLLYTAQRGSDVAVMGRQHIKDGKLVIRQQKTKAHLTLPITGELRSEIDGLSIPG